jgi:hypothetical protein
MADQEERIDISVDNALSVHLTQNGHPIMRIAFARVDGRIATFQLVLSPAACLQHMAPTIVYDPMIVKPVLIKAGT